MRRQEFVNSDHRARVAEMLELVKLAGFENRRASTLSGSQLQRVALARALAPAPQVLLLDEPLSALDKQLRDAMQSELKNIQREMGVTAISVTHDQAEALSMSDSVVMDQGRVVQQGTAEEMYCRPRSEFLARFLGEVNLLPVDAHDTCTALGREVPGGRGQLLVVRPEDLHPASPGEAGLDGRVHQVQFHGANLRLEVEVPDHDQPLVVRNGYAGIGSLPSVGERIRLTHRATELHCVDPAASPPVGPGSTRRTDVTSSMVRSRRTSVTAIRRSSRPSPRRRPFSPTVASSGPGRPRPTPSGSSACSGPTSVGS